MIFLKIFVVIIPNVIQLCDHQQAATELAVLVVMEAVIRGFFLRVKQFWIQLRPPDKRV